MTRTTLTRNFTIQKNAGRFCGSRWSIWIVLMVIVSQLSACGFRPRGSATGLTDTGSIFVDTPRGSSIGTELRKALSDRAFTVVANRDDADVLLRVLDEQQKQRILSVQSTGKVSELELSHSVNILVAQSMDDQPPRYDPEQPSNRVEVIREYTYDQDDVLGKENEAVILRGEMRKELVRQILLRTVATLALSVTS